MGEARWLTVRAAGGRDLEVLVDGPDGGTVLLFHNGTPTAAVRNPHVVNPAAQRGMRTVTYSRPGYAASTPHHRRSIADAAQDAEAILDALHADHFVTLGWSGGGPHALACAALLPERCAAAATIAGVAPYGAAGLEWLAGMGPENIAEFSAAIEGKDRLEPYLEREAVPLRRVTGTDVAAALGGLVSEVDKNALTGDFAELVAETFRRAVSGGIAGWRDDDLGFTRPWGFELKNIRTPVAIWHGAHDRMVPFNHGRWLAANIPRAQSRLLDDEGHISVLNHIDRILEDLVELGTEHRSGN